ncbi:hypothetical protein GCM10010520_33690 [Rhizobium viscosum]
MEFTPLALRLHVEAPQQIEGDLSSSGQMDRCVRRDEGWPLLSSRGDLSTDLLLLSTLLTALTVKSPKKAGVIDDLDRNIRI